MWVWDAPSGTYKDHALSSKIRVQAVADSVFMQFVRPEPNYGKRRGESITITRILKLPLARRVAEQETLPSGRPPIETKSVKVSEWGFKILTTEFEQNLTYYDIRNPFQTTLRDQMRLTMDKMVADANKLTPIKYIPTASGGTFDTDGVPSTQADVNLGIADLRNIHDYLRATLKCPMYRNGKYVGILSTRAARGIKNDPEYKDWQAPTTAGPFMDARLRDVEGFALFETNHVDPNPEDAALDNDIGLNGILGEAIFFGADNAFLAEVDRPELRAGLPMDLGRFREMGWVGTVEAGLTWDKAAQGRTIHVSSS